MKYSSIIKYVPNTLSIIRGFIAVILVLDALDGRTSPWFVTAFIIASVTDMLDGPIARRFNVTTTLGSKLDSSIDAILFGGIVYCVWLVHRETVSLFWIPILIVGITQLTSWAISLIKYGKLTCYHSYVAKFWTFTISLAVVLLFGFNYAGFFFWTAIICGIISNLEDMAMTLILPYWAHDVLTVTHAIRLRKEFIKKSRK